MIKIEKLLDGAKATIVQAGEEVQVFPGQLVNSVEIKTIKVLSGTVVYSIDEGEIVEVKAPAKAVTKPEPKSVVRGAEPAVATTKEAPKVTK